MTASTRVDPVGGFVLTLIAVSRHMHPSFMLGLLLLVVTVIPSYAQTSAGTNNNAETVYQLQQLQDEVRQLRGMLEQQSFELENIKRRQRDQYLELDQRLSAPTSTANSAGSNQDDGILSSPNSVASADSNAVTASDVPEVREPMTDQRQIEAVVRPSIGQQQALTAPPATEQQAYDQAFDALKALRYSESAGLFRDFIQRYPDSDLAANAQYWLGESYYASGNYDLALSSFNDLLDKYPNSSKAGDALLKIGYTHYEKKSWAQARAALEQVKAQHAGTALERLAESRLRSMRADGRF
ncbi:MAG: tol-pal system protein YbgF [Gammaproteobacteria bacterium]|jgi:tol-pal system protein YbgF|nr:tol-pal system protein YbgF [Gammaproteobacteria bacterium]